MKTTSERTARGSLPGAQAPAAGLSKVLAVLRSWLSAPRHSLQVRLVLLVLAVSAASTTGFVFLVVRDSSERPLREAAALTSAEASKGELLIAQALRDLRGDALLLAGTPAVAAIVGARDREGVDPRPGDSRGEWRDQLAQIFEGAAAKGHYQQLRLLDAGGRELVRVDSDGAVAWRVPESELQDKSERPYFREAASASPGEVVLSPLELNREHDAIEVPHVPVIRVSVPLFDEAERLRGVLITNVYAAHFLDFFTGDVRLRLVDQAGQYLIHPDPGMTFGTELGSGISLKSELGDELAALILSGEHGSGQTGDQALSYLPMSFEGFTTANRWTLVTAAPAARVPLTSLTQIWLLGSFVALVAVGGAYLIARRVTAPVFELRAAAAAVSAGHTEHPIPGTERQDEVGSLARSVAVMTGRLTQANRDLEQRVRDRTVELESTNHELSAVESRLRARNRELVAANAELEDFTYSVAHDLRQPLRAIDGFSQTLFRDYYDLLDDQGRHRLQRVRDGAQRLGELIDDVLELARMTRVELRRERVDVSALARSIAGTLRASAPDRAVRFQIEDGMEAEADVALVRAALQHLIGNAWKFTSRHMEARIEVGSQGGGEEHAFYVRDDGAGFSMEYAQKLFGPFQRLHSAAEFEGNGVGLASVERIARRHGGRCWAEGAVEQGATFYFTLAPAEGLPVTRGDAA